MKVNFDGLRRNMLSGLEGVVKKLNQSIDEEGFVRGLSASDLDESFGNLKRSITSICCVFSENSEDSMSDMSDDIDKYDIDYNPEKKTSQEWVDEYPGELIIHDPDGWDRENFHKSFHEEKITESEFELRLAQSTIEVKG